MRHRIVAPLAALTIAAGTAAVTAAPAHAEPAPPNLRVAGQKCDGVNYATLPNGKRVLSGALCGRQITPKQLVGTLRSVGFTWKYMEITVATIYGESMFYTHAMHWNHYPSGRVKSVDCGAWQINQQVWPEAKKPGNCFDFKKQSKLAKKIIGKTSIKTWNANDAVGPIGSGNTYNVRAREYIAAAKKAGVK